MSKITHLKRWYVIDGEEHLTSYSAKADKPEMFTTLAAAKKRAVALANSEPGKLFFICEATHFADAEIASATYKPI